MEATRQNTGLTATFALSYSARYEILEACRAIAREAVLKKIDPDVITENTISEHLMTAGIPDPDLLIRTSGEMRISNFLLWQISYTELYVTEKFWPEFDDDEFMKAIEAYQKRERRFGRTRPLGTQPV
jgi:undecaprenyl diphosphate synthase